MVGLVAKNFVHLQKHSITIHGLRERSPFFFLWGNSPNRSWTTSVLMFLDHTIRHTHTHSVGLLWTNDLLVAGAATCTTQQTRRGEHPRPQLNSKPQSQQVSSCRPTPYTVRSLGSTLSPLQPSNLQCDSEQSCSENKLNLSCLLNRSSTPSFQPYFLGKFGCSRYNGQTHTDQSTENSPPITFNAFSWF